MNKDLSRFNDLVYNEGSSSEKQESFVDFLIENSEISTPEIDVNTVWTKHSFKIASNIKNDFRWVKIVASILLIAVVSFFLFTMKDSPNVLISSLDKKKAIKFSDGSFGILNKNSTFEFQETFGKERIVKLTGEAYFDIQKDNRQFTIEVGNARIIVHGTAFNVKETNHFIEVFIDHGQVSFETKAVDQLLTSGMSARLMKSGTMVLEDEVSPNITAWRTGKFNFKNTPLSLVLEELSSFYDFKYAISSNFESCLVTAKFNKAEFSQLVETLELLLGATFTFSNKQLNISGTGCH